MRMVELIPRCPESRASKGPIPSRELIQAGIDRRLGICSEDLRMNGPTPSVPMMLVPTPAQAERAVRQARELFQHTLANWAFDSLRLRRSGAHRLTWNSSPHTEGLSKAA
jgi:hypothetical protein